MKTIPFPAFRLPVSIPLRLRRMLAAFVLPILATGVFIAPARAQTVTSAVPNLISYQGKVSNANGTLVGAGTPVNRLVAFRIWSHQSNSTINDLVYSEQQTVTVSEGEFSVLIGQGSVVSGLPLGYSESSKNSFTAPSVFGGATRFLGVTIDDGNGVLTNDPEISPRQQLVSSAFAMRAKFAESLGANGANTIVALDTGNVGIGSSNPGARLEVAGNIRAGGAGITSPSLQLLANSATTVAASIGYANSAGNFSTDAAANDTVFRTENGGKLLLQTGAGASGLVIDGSNRVGIGISSPNAALDVNGALMLRGALTNASGRPTVGSGRVAAEIGGYSSVAATADDGLLRLSAGGGTTPGAKSFIDLTGFSNVADMDKTLVFGTAGAERMRINSSGNVGIGTNAPSRLLQLSATGDPEFGLQSTSAGGRSWTLMSTSTSPYAGLFQIIDRTANAARMIINSSGNVGIGTYTPSAMLQIGQGANSGPGGLLINTGWINTGNFSENRPLEVQVRGTPYLVVNTNGNVGFGGITNPTQATVAIGGSGVNQSGLVGAYINNGVASNAVTHGVHPVSLYTSGTIWCGNTVIATSDARTKEVQGRSNASEDLQTLLGIEITDFQYKDRIAKGESPQKKVIAQQVEKIFPQAVGQRTETVPDIYSSATYRDGWVRLANTLKPGEKVRLIGDKSEGIYEVLEAKPYSFRTAFAPATETVFVYGREVNDFRTVDYDAIAMLNVSATQELARQNVALTRRVAELEAKDRARDAKIAAIEKLLSTSSTVMALPEKSATASGQE